MIVEESKKGDWALLKGSSCWVQVVENWPADQCLWYQPPTPKYGFFLAMYNEIERISDVAG